MIKVWMNKQCEEKPDEQYAEAVVFNLLDDNKDSNIKTDIHTIWERFNENNLSPINEDLLVISIAVLAIDKQIPRDYFINRWTRDIWVSLPVQELGQWRKVNEKLEKMLSFLTGDKWKIDFRKSDNKLRPKSPFKKKIDYIQNRNFHGVCLFSGGLDSFCGALKLLSEQKNILFAGFREYNKLGPRQTDLYNAINDFYKDNNTALMLLGIRFKRPIGESTELSQLSKENTSRSRSFLFMAIALGIASIIGKDIPIYVPENGFIGINVPLTDSRLGSCSTRTTHPYFVNTFNEILMQIGITNKIQNFYSHKTKGEIVAECKDNPVFQGYYSQTLSCSHPCQSRYDGKPVPMNCGYCYPCIIRKAALASINSDLDVYNYQLSKHLLQLKDKGSDLRAVLMSLKEFLSYGGDSDYLRSKILKHGKISVDDAKEYQRVYINSMREIYEMVLKQKDGNKRALVDYLDISGHSEV